MLGRLLDRLRATGLYDRAVLVVTADHGVSFRAGQKRRPLSEGNLEDIAYVPLFVKTPGQQRGRIAAVAARTTDIFPTLAGASRCPHPLARRRALAARPAPGRGERDPVKDKG